MSRTRPVRTRARARHHPACGEGAPREGAWGRAGTKMSGVGDPSTPLRWEGL
eukprot:COSAG02_NODE_4673_length_5107_cov_2.513578_5_plen_52_part_00